MTVCTNTTYIHESGTDLIPFQYMSEIQDGGPFSYITKCQIGTLLYLTLYYTIAMLYFL